MATALDPEWSAWAATELGGSDPRVLPLRPDGGPWLIDAGGSRAVLRADTGGARILRREHAVLALLASRGLRVPTSIAWRDDDAVSLHLIEWVDASSAVPRERDDERLARFGAETARIAAVTAPVEWPVKHSPIESTDFAGMLREHPHALLEAGARALADLDPPSDDATGVVHGDLWHGNTLWSGDELRAVIDWDHAGRGPSGLDLGSVRFDAALYFGDGAEDAVLTGWEDQAGRPARDVAYWDAVSAVASPPDLAWFVPTIIADGKRPDLDRPTLIGRRDRFLERALTALGR